MAATRTYFDQKFINLGPLTETFAAPASCATQDGFAAVEYVTVQTANDEAFTRTVRYYADCFLPGPGDCAPSGDAWDAIASSIADEGYDRQYAFFSPGVVCPEGFTTAGTLRGGAEPTGAGIFENGTDPLLGDVEEGSVAVSIPKFLALEAVLEDDETFVQCCPR
jgi:hypothetical protein